VEPVNLPDLGTPVRDMARSDVVRLLENETISQALARFRSEEVGERIVYFYVTDDAGRLVGVVPTRRLILSDPSRLVGDVMIHPAVAVRESEPFGNALQTITERRLLALPVVDDAGRLTGVLDVAALTQTLVDLERREAADELFQLAGIHIEQERSRSELWILKRRLPWLLFNVCSGIGAAFISEAFDGLLRLVVVIAFFVPLVLTLAESVAMQSVTMSLNQLQVTRRVRGAGGVLREMRAGVLLGIACGAIVSVIGLVWMRSLTVAGVMAGATVLAGAIGATFGFFVPRMVRRWKLNPTIASGPVTLALTDLAALTCYFGLSSLVLL
jgi:magnesium transporter